jgi:lipid-binding SYLF domain-containing protein/osmotically-inducible protein OsmY
MKKLVSLFGVMTVLTATLWGQEARSKELDRVQAAQKVLSEIVATPDKGIPEDIMASAKCVAVIPSLIKGGFIFGARYGKGIATCRTTDDHWSAPAPVRITGGSFGLQIGGEAVDLVMLVMNQHGMDNLLASKFKVGADVSGAAGPVGRQASASTDWKMRAEVLTYSRARGIFGGVELSGAQIKQDTDDTLALYGKYVRFNTILSGKVPPPAGTQPFVKEVATDFRMAQEKKAANAERNAAAAERKAGETGGSSGTSTRAAGAAGNTTAANTHNDSRASNGAAADSSASASLGDASPAQVQAKIEDQLRNTRNLSAQDVNVNVTSDQVSVSGSVPSPQDKSTIDRIAEENAGGRKVDDSNLSIK